MGDDKKTKCDDFQYKFLLKCSKENNIESWNNWRKKHPKKEIWLERADLKELKLQNANLEKAQLSHAKLFKTNLKNATLTSAILIKAKMRKVRLQNAFVKKANLEGANLWEAKLQNTRLNNSILEKSILNKAQLQNAKLIKTNLKGANLKNTNLKGTKFISSTVDSATSIWTTLFNEETDFTGVGLDNCRIDPGLKTSLKDIIRKKRWEEWYQENPLLKRPVQVFWWFTDYGNSTSRIISSFFGLVFIFGLLYFCIEWFTAYKLFNDLRVYEEFISYLDKPWYYTLSRSMYFSIVTMTTLGFGDIHARPDSITGHIILSLHVIIGYVLLGALITRLGILFTQEGPSYRIHKIKPNLTSRIFKRLSKIISKPKDSDSE